MKQFLAILLIASLTWQCTVHLGIYAWYEMNKDYVAKNLCVNRNKPQMKCCGKCYLHKQLKKADENNTDGKQAPTKMDKLELAAFVIPEAIQFHELHSSIVIDHKAAAQPVYIFNYSAAIFHPPAVC